MSLVKETLAGYIDTNLLAIGASGGMRYIFCLAVATGIVDHTVGRKYKTKDNGKYINGKGEATGIKSMVENTMVSDALAIMWGRGANAELLIRAIMQGTIKHYKEATLKSKHPGVGEGSGEVVAGSYDADMGTMRDLIYAELIKVGNPDYASIMPPHVKAYGDFRFNLSEAIATGICNMLTSEADGGNIEITGGGGEPKSPHGGEGEGKVS